MDLDVKYKTIKYLEKIQEKNLQEVLREEFLELPANMQSIKEKQLMNQTSSRLKTFTCERP